jgi:hypothetical protein
VCVQIWQKYASAEISSVVMKAAFADYNLLFLYEMHTQKIQFNIPEPPHLVLLVKSILSFNQDSTLEFKVRHIL